MITNDPNYPFSFSEVSYIVSGNPLLRRFQQKKT